MVSCVAFIQMNWADCFRVGRYLQLLDEDTTPRILKAIEQG